MYRNLYDTDVTVWSPQGRLFQVEYAMEGVKLGTCAVGLRSDKAVVLAGLRRSMSKLAQCHRKLARIDDHCGMTFSGISADARYLAEYMRRECLSHKFLYQSDHPISELVDKISAKSHQNTQSYSKRPFGCGLLIAGVDTTGPHLYETSPSGNFTEYYSVAFGSRCQASRTYLEQTFEKFKEMSEEELLYNAICALAKSVPQDEELTTTELGVGVVSEGGKWRELSDEELRPFFDRLAAENITRQPAALEVSS